MSRHRRSLSRITEEIEITETRSRIGIRRDENVGRIRKDNFPSVVITFSKNISVLNFVTGISGIKHVSSVPEK